jgi:phage/plasmid-like protein (TIGR03299 family)
MPHEVESAFFTHKPAWHGLGTVLDRPPTVAEAITAAGLGWRVVREPLHTPDGRTAPAFATVRESDRRILGVVGPQYRVLQIADSFAFFQPFLDAGQATRDAAGSLRQGQRVWVLAKLSGGPLEVAAGDVVERYLLLSNSHDGTLAVRVGFTPIRVVCANTLAMAHGADASKLVRVRHTASVKDGLAAIRDVMDAANARFKATAEQYRGLARRCINSSDVRRYVRQVFQVAEDATPSPRMANLLGRVEWLWQAGRGNQLPAVRGTAWAACNAVTEYLGAEAGRGPDSRLNSLWFGGGAQVSKRALEAALALAA